MRLLAAVLIQVEWSTDRTVVMDLRREVTRWLNRVFAVAPYQSSSLATHIEVLTHTLNEWMFCRRTNFTDLSHWEDTPQKALKWMIRVHLDSLCFGFTTLITKSKTDSSLEETIQVDRAALTLQAVGPICQISTARRFQSLVPIFADTCSDVARTLNPSIAIKLLVDPLQSFAGADQEAEELSFVTQQMLTDVIEAQFLIVRKKIEQRLDAQYSKAKKWASLEELQEMENRKRNPPTWEYFNELLTYEPELWGLLLHWKTSELLQSARSPTIYLDRVLSVAQRIEKIFQSLNTNAIHGHITVDLLRKVYASREQLLPGWQSLQCEFAVPGFIETLEAEIQNALLTVKSSVKILNVLAPESVLSTDTQTAVNNWTALTLNTVRVLLRSPLPPSHQEYADSFLEFYGVEFSRRIRTYPPLPEVFLKTLDVLLLSTEKVDFFSRMWFANTNGEVTDENLCLIREVWHSFFQSLLAGEVTFATLDSNQKFLEDHNELSVLIQTCLGANPWNFLEKSSSSVQETLTSLQSKLKKWKKVQNLVRSKENVLKVIEVATESVLTDGGITDIKRWGAQLEDLCRLVQETGAWDSQTLQDLETYWEFANLLDESMTRVSLKLLSALRDNAPLLTFLRIIRDDSAFTSSLEVALGLQEMECPAELWDSDHGRVDERYLSMARNIRSYLYNFLYNYPPALASTRSFLDVFSTLNEAMSPEVIAENICECNRVRDAFMEIMQFKSEGASSSRLLKLYEPKCRSHWILKYGSGNLRKANTKGGLQLDLNEDNQRLQGHDLTLDYVTISGNSGEQEKKQSHALPELLDFQSNIVLSKEGDVLGGNFQETVDKFLHQLGWVRKLREVLSQLSAAGHFSYHPHYSLSISVQLEDDYFPQEVAKAQSELDQWVSQISRLRKQFYFMNFFDIKRCYSLLSVLQTLHRDGFDKFSPRFGEVKTLLRSFVSFVNADAAACDEIVSAVTDSFCNHWVSIGAAEGITSDHLEPLSSSLHQCCLSILPRVRPLVVEFDLEEYVTLPTLKNRTVYTTCSPSSKVELEQALTFYIARGEWPEWETCLLCSKHTTLEMVTNFIHRWKSSHQNNRSDRLYYLLGSDSLPYHIQESVCFILREFLFQSSFSTANSTDATLGPLVLSCKGEAHSNPLIALFQNMALATSTLPDRLISQIFDRKCNSLGVEVFSGRFAGCGKTFNILTKASEESLDYTYIPVNSSISLPAERKILIERILNTLSVDPHSTLPLYHFDVASTVNDTFAGFLFEFCVLGVVPDLEGESVVFPPPGSSICIELAASLLETSLPHCRAYPQRRCKVSRDVFQSSFDCLRSGMGAQFASPLYDGTWKIGAQTTPVDAFHRLRYVTVALNILRHAHGTFPYSFSLKEISDLHEPQPNVSFVGSSIPRDLPPSSVHDTLEVKEKQGEARTQVAQQAAFENLLMTGYGLTSEIAYDLLFDAMTNSIVQEIGSEQRIKQTQQNTHVSLWCLWNFVNVVYWQLTEMHHIDSPLNGACMPDANAGDRTLAEDTRTKRKIKGEIIQFILRTAVEFATRQSKLKKFSDSIVELSVSGMSRSVFNKRWRRMEYDNDGKPCFRSACGNFYFYYRALARCWVIDDIIETSGSTYAYSQTDDINSTWISSPEWSRSTVIESRSESTTNTGAYRGEAIRISGCAKLGGKTYCSAAEDGLYLRQPPYDDINGQPHYIKFTSPHDPVRRHLFFASERRWIVAPQCNEDQGYFIMGEGSVQSCHWMYLPPDQPEKQSKLSFIKRGDDNDKEEPLDDEDSPINEFEIELVKWKDSNHECILFNNIAHTVAFLSARPKEMKSRLHPVLLRHLEQNSISVEGGTGRDESFSSSHWKTLSALTGVVRDDRQASQILNGSYCLTGDSLLKILAIVYRVTCGIPVVLLGECGCGKTMLLSFLCAWMNVTLLCLDVHGGTTEADILQIFDEAAEILESKPDQKSVFVFLDEINTCGHMGLITEAICHRSINGQRLHEGVQILAALNPYRIRPQRTEENVDAGLEYTKSAIKISGDAGRDMKHLVYKVHPIPPTLKDFIFDFGSLDGETEALYVQSMIANQLSSYTNPDERSILADMISRSQIYLREFEGDPSVVSLRDVQRCLDLLNWFYVKIGVGKVREAKGTKVVISPLCRSAVLAIAHVYGYRLPSAEARKSFYSMLTSMIKRWGKTAVHVNFDALGRAGFVQTILENMQRKFVNNLTVEPTIAMNQALTENLFVTIICILNKIPIFIVGKPGTSKTLAIQIIASNLQGKLSPMPLWKNFPAVYIFQYQCSPLSTSASILYQFESAKSYQEHSEDVMTVLLLDEVGLAENSPDMPLKVLHYMLVNPPIAIVGLSNWALDSSKMNRAVCLQRPEPSAEDIMFTGQNIVGTAALDDESSNNSLGRSQFQPWLMSLARAFHALYSDQKKFFGSQSRNFIGMRDYYSLLKYLRDKVSTSIDPDTLSLAVARNFGGRPDAMQSVLELFHKSCFNGSNACPPCPPPLDLIQKNLASTSSRHLMILSANDSALQLLIGCKILDPSTTTVLVGSRFKDDLHELHIIQQINQVKNAMAKGQVVTLLHNESMFESLYDVLNQRYVYKTDIETGVEKKMLRLALGPRSQLCPVSDGFKLVVIVDQQQAYDSLDLPLLNRFEKQVLFPRNLLNSQGAAIALDKLSEWCDLILKESGCSNLSEVFCGFYSDTLSSLVLNLSSFSTLRIVSAVSDSCGQGCILLSDLLSKGKDLLCRVAFPSAILMSPTLRTEISGIYQVSDLEHLACLTPQSNLFSLLELELISQKSNKFLFITTKSPITHFHPAFQSWLGKDSSMDSTQFRVLQLALISSERQFTSELNNFLQYGEFGKEDKKTMIVLCDPLLCESALISHARYLCVRLASQSITKKYFRNIVFVVHLPPGVSSRQREFILDLNPPWQYRFVDDIRYSEESEQVSLPTLLQNSPFDLFSSSEVLFRESLQSNFQAALVRCIVPKHETFSGEVSSIKVVKDLLQHSEFFDFIRHAVLACLMVASEQDSHTQPLHVRIACSAYENNMGTLRESLLLALDCLFVQSLAHVIRTLDVDFNLHYIHQLMTTNPQRCETFLEGWLEIANKLMGAHPFKGCVLVSPTSPEYFANCVTQNTGLHGFLRCQFPFSDRVISMIGSDTTRFQIESVISADSDLSQLVQMSRSISSLLVSVLGGEGEGSILSSFLSLNPVGYLHDFVNITIHPLPGLTERTYFNVMKLVVDCHSPSGSLYPPSIIHACYWTYEHILFHMFSVLSIVNTQVLQCSLTDVCPEKWDEWFLSMFATLPGETVVEKFVDGMLNCFMNSLLACVDYDIKSSNGFRRVVDLMRIVRKTFPHLRTLLRSCLSDVSDRNLDRIMRPYWMMRYSDLVLKEFISYLESKKTDVAKDAFDIPIMHDFLASFLSLHNTISPLDSNALQTFCNLCQEMAAKFPPLATNLLRSYVFDFVQAEHEFVATVSSISFSPDMLHQLGQLVSDLPNAYLSVRRCIVGLLASFLVGTEHQNSANAAVVLSEIVGKGSIEGSEVALLFINHIEDMISTKAGTNISVSPDTLIALERATDGADFFVLLSTQGPRIFETIATMKTLIRDYASDLANYLSSTSFLDCRFPPIESTELSLLLSETESVRFFLLKCLRVLGGNDLLFSYLQRAKNHPCLPSGVTLIRDNAKTALKLSFLNPFPLVFGKDQYFAACEVYKKSLIPSSRGQLTSWLKNSRSKSTNFCSLMAAVHTEKFLGDDLSELSHYLDNAPSCYSNAYYGQVNESAIRSFAMGWVLQLHRGDQRTKYDHNIDQLLVHVAIIAAEFPQSLPAAFIHDISILPKLFLPGMPQNEMTLLARAMGYVGWYQCPNGHPYTVGECTYPMEESRCSAPGCGALIGGRNHNSAMGTVRLGAGAQAETPGYIPIPDTEDLSVTSISVLVLRFFVHCSLFICTLNRRNRGVLHKILGLPDSQSRDNLDKVMRERLERDYACLKTKTQFADDDLSMALHQTLKGSSVPEIMNLDLRHAVNRHQLETTFQSTATDPIFASKRSLELIQSAREENSGATTTLILQDCFQSLWGRVTEVLPRRRGQELSAEETLNDLWRIREPLSFENFQRKFSLCSTHIQPRYPVLSAVLENETVLPYIKYIADILAWHSFLFSVLPSTTTREQAAIWTLADVLKSIAPDNRKAEGWTKMRAFCEAFNESFHLVGFLYECNANPFITNDGRVDLSGGKRGGDDVCMNENSTLNFSLPSSSHGETDATGLCTIRLLTTLQDCHNRIVRVLDEIPRSDVLENEAWNDDDDETVARPFRMRPAAPLLRPGLTPAMRALNQDTPAPEPPKLPELSPALKIPVTSLRTPPELARQRLLIYDRHKILMPIVAASTLQSLQPGLGRVSEYDFRRINSDLRETLLATCAPLALHIFQYQYAGEIRKSGGLRGLGTKSKQIPLSVAILDEIWKEIDTQNRLTRLLALLEGCIAFIVASGATQLADGEVLLEDYILGTLLMDPKKWEEIRCPTLAQQVHLHHIQCLYLDLEQRNGQDPLAQVALAYRDPISEELHNQLRQILLKIDFSVFTPILREFCTEQLSAGTWPSDGSLKEFIGYSTEVDLDALAWFHLLPDELELRHAYEVYKIAANPSACLA